MEGFGGTLSGNKEFAGLGIDCPKIQPPENYRDSTNSGVSTADVEGEAVAIYFLAGAGYSVRSAFIGSTRVARNAGRYMPAN